MTDLQETTILAGGVHQLPSADGVRRKRLLDQYGDSSVEKGDRHLGVIDRGDRDGHGNDWGSDVGKS